PTHRVRSGRCTSAARGCWRCTRCRRCCAIRPRASGSRPTTGGSTTGSTAIATRWPISASWRPRCTNPWRRCSVPVPDEKPVPGGKSVPEKNVPEKKLPEKKLRVYVPVTVPMLRRLLTEREIFPVGGTAFAVTPALREAYASGDDEELAEVAMSEAARASLRLIAAEREDLADALEEALEPSGDGAPEPGPAAHGGPVYRRAVLAADVTGAVPRPDLDDAVVKL